MTDSPSEPGSADAAARGPRWAAWLAGAVLAGLYTLHVLIAIGSAVNVPYWDEWDALPDKSMAWLLVQHNEHRILTTKLIVLALYKINGWNLVTHQCVNFVLYGLMLLALLRFIRMVAPSLPAWAAMAFLVFPLSPTAYENLNWGFQSQFHLAALFFILCVSFLFASGQRWWELALGTAAGLLSMYSAASGLVCVALAMAAFTLFKGHHLLRSADGDRRRDGMQLAMVLAGFGVAYFFWFVGYWFLWRPQPAPGAVVTYFLDLVGFGLGFDPQPEWRGAVCLAVVALPVIVDVLRNGRSLTARSWAVHVATLCLLGSLFVTALARADSMARSPRYAEIGMLLVPLSAAAWSVVLRTPKTRATALVLLWVCYGLAFRDNWADFGPYGSAGRLRSHGVACAVRYYSGTGDGYCPSLHPLPMGKQLDRAKKLNLSFFRDVRALITPPPGTETQDTVTSTLHSIDILNDVSAPAAPAAPRPIVIAQGAPVVNVGGWAVDSEAVDEAGDVAVIVDGGTEVLGKYGYDRYDVARVFQNNRYRYCGFLVSISREVLSKGRHRLTLKIWKAGRKGYWLSPDVLDVEVL